MRTVGCGLDARVLSTLLLRAVPLTRQGVRAAFCVKNRASVLLFTRTLLIFLVGTPTEVCTPDAVVCSPDVPAVVSWRCCEGCLAVRNPRNKNALENQMLMGPGEPKRTKKGRSVGIITFAKGSLVLNFLTSDWVVFNLLTPDWVERTHTLPCIFTS